MGLCGQSAMIQCPYCSMYFSEEETVRMDLVKIRDGEVVLYKRPNSSNWQARLKLPNGKWHRISTKRSNIDEAKRIAGKKYDWARFREQEGLSAVSRRFRDVAKLTISDLQAKTAAGHGKAAYKDYIQAINNYLIPYFGNTQIEKITQQDIAAFEAWRIKQLKRNPAASTVLNHNAALNKVFDTALAQGWVKKNAIPDLKVSGIKSKRRPDFTLEEMKKINSGFRPWIERATSAKNRMYRELMRDYVRILVNTGIRTGKEAMKLKWSQIRLHKKKNKEWLAISVSGKTGERELIATPDCFKIFPRIQSRFPDLASQSFEELIASRNDNYVFRLANGKMPVNFCHLFEDYLTELGLLTDKHGNKRTLYSLRHTYATFQIVYGKVDIHLLAKQMGTSIQMLEQHYSHLEPIQQAHLLAGQGRKAKA